jgi:hypothetical protein
LAEPVADLPERLDGHLVAALRGGGDDGAGDALHPAQRLAQQQLRAMRLGLRAGPGETHQGVA